jgi:hypothetical protein
MSRVKVSPDLATQWLGYNTHNRPTRPTVVTAYAEAMSTGDWRTDTDPIRFAGVLGGRGKHTPVLVNGQHRLQAQLIADATLEYFVIEGLDITAQTDMDAGVKRQLGDQLRLMGHQYPTELSAVLRLSYAYEHDILKARHGATYATLLRFLEEHPDLPDSIPPARRVYENIGGRVSVYGAGHYIMSCIDQPGIADDVDEFWERLRYGDGLEPGSSILLYRNQIIGLQNQTASRRRMSQQNQLALLFKAWNAWRDGVKLSSLSWRGGGKNAESFPIPE